MLKKGTISLVVWVLGLLIGTSLSVADQVSIDGTMWMYEHESGARHYIAFYADYHYLNSASCGQEQPDSLWLRSMFPYFSNTNLDGSINYGATHISFTAWAINWGKCDINADYASFNAFGMLTNIIIYNHNEPYILVSTDWYPPHPD